MKTELIKEFEEKHQRSRFLQDTGIGDMHSEQGCYCDEYVEFLEQKLANGVEQSDSNCNIPHVIKSVCKYGMNPDDCIRKADTCFDCLKDS